MLRLVVVLALTLVAGCATDSIPRDYSGADTGWLVLSIRETNDNLIDSYSFDIRSKDGARRLGRTA